MSVRRWSGNPNAGLVAKSHLTWGDGYVGGTHLTVQLRAGLGRDACAILDKRGGAVRRELTRAQRDRRVLESLDQTLKTVLRHSGPEC